MAAPVRAAWIGVRERHKLGRAKSTDHATDKQSFGFSVVRRMLNPGADFLALVLYEAECPSRAGDITLTHGFEFGHL